AAVLAVPGRHRDAGGGGGQAGAGVGRGAGAEVVAGLVDEAAVGGAVDVVGGQRGDDGVVDGALLADVVEEDLVEGAGAGEGGGVGGVLDGPVVGVGPSPVEDEAGEAEQGEEDDRHEDGDRPPFPGPSGVQRTRPAWGGAPCSEEPGGGRAGAAEPPRIGAQHGGSPVRRV